jgi:hemoglobin-like flavoprotein
MTPEQITLVRTSFAEVEPIADTAASLFYGRLFEQHATLRPLFTGDMHEQGRKLMATLRVVVDGLDRLDRLVPAVRSLGERHVRYGVQEEHYAAVGNALLWTLERGLGPAYTPEVEAAWTAAYTLLATTMIGAAATASRSGPEEDLPAAG